MSSGGNAPGQMQADPNAITTMDMVDTPYGPVNRNGNGTWNNWGRGYGGEDFGKVYPTPQPYQGMTLFGGGAGGYGSNRFGSMQPRYGGYGMSPYSGMGGYGGYGMSPYMGGYGMSPYGGMGGYGGGYGGYGGYSPYMGGMGGFGLSGLGMGGFGGFGSLHQTFTGSPDSSGGNGTWNNWGRGYGAGKTYPTPQSYQGMTLY